jgi:uncharacterized protein YjbI with pentapeptide repeats/beta-lactamase regulating signal transducer with metallopeptidase domain
MHALAAALEPVARIVVATLFNSLWEAALLAFAVWAILRLLPNLNATTRYAAWCVALVASLLLPLATTLPQVCLQTAAVSTPSSPQQTVVVPKHTAHHHAVIPSSQTVEPAAPTAMAPALHLPGRLKIALPEYVALGLFAIWGLATVLLLARLGVNLWRLERLKSDALPLPVEYRDRLSRWGAAEKGGRDVRLCICDRIDVPVAVGLFDSMILLPQHLLERLSQEEVDQIMLHELAHLRRADDWTNGLQRVIQALFFFNPAVLYISQQLDLEREVACDDWVVHQTREVRPYATCLTKMAEVTAWPHRPLAAPGVFVTRRGLSVRVERLLNAGRNVRTSIAFGPAGGIVAALVVLFFVLQNVAPSFAFTLPQDTMKTHETILAQAVPSPSPATPSPKPTATPREKNYVVVRAQHIHRPARDLHVHVPAMTVNIPEQRILLPKVAVHPSIPPIPHVHVTMPPGFSESVNRQAAESVREAMQSVNASMQAMRLAQQDTRKMNCVGCDYTGQNLAGHSFRNQRLSGADFTRANLQNADFSGSVLVGPDFSRANLRGANFSHAKITGCDLSSADVTGAIFDGATVVGCDVNARHLTATQARALLLSCRTGCDFSGANLQGQDLHGLALSGIDLTGADLRNADLSNVKFTGVDFTGARLDGARVTGARFSGCDFSGVDLHNVDMSDAEVVGSSFRQRSSPTP